MKPLADRYGVPFHDVGTESGSASEERLLERLERYEVDLIVLVRYIRILDPNVVFRYEDWIINVHPTSCRRFPAPRRIVRRSRKGCALRA